MNLDGIEARLNAKSGTLDKTRDHLIHVSMIHGASKNVAAQQARRVEPTASALKWSRHKGAGNE
jgi:hypothetical protein